MFAMASVDLGRYKKIVQYFWDPEPKNDDSSELPIWCLGKKYTSSVATEPDGPPPQQGLQRDQISHQGLAKPLPACLNNRHAEQNAGEPRDVHGGRGSVSGSEDQGGWPSPFLKDFESRIWFTYRSNFPSIKKSPDPTTSSAMSLSVRIRSQLVDQGGFTSDTGWGCMIRSGQCLLANALVMLRLGRGMIGTSKLFGTLQLIKCQIGGGEQSKRRSCSYSHCSPMIQMHPFRYTDSYSTVLSHVVNTPANGLGLLQLQDVSSKSSNLARLLRVE